MRPLCHFPRPLVSKNLFFYIGYYDCKVVTFLRLCLISFRDDSSLHKKSTAWSDDGNLKQPLTKKNPDRELYKISARPRCSLCGLLRLQSCYICKVMSNILQRWFEFTSEKHQVKRQDLISGTVRSSPFFFPIASPHNCFLGVKTTSG